MIGVWAAVLVLGAAVWLMVDGLYAPDVEGSARPARHSFNRLKHVLLEAELDKWSPTAVLLGSTALSIVLLVVTYQALGWIVPSLFVAAAGAIAPVAYILWRRDRLAEAREEALVVALERAQEELRTLTIQEMLLSLERTAPAAVQPAFRRLAWDLEHQRDFADALRASQLRLSSRVWDSCVAALLLSQSVGERSLRSVLKRVAANARAEVQLRRSIRAQQVQHVTSARITLVVPIAVVLYMRAAYPAAEHFYASPLGELILLFCGASMVFGYWSMLRLGSIGRAPRSVEEPAV